MAVDIVILLDDLPQLFRFRMDLYMDGKRENINWIDTAKGVCILLVVIYHVIITSYHPFAHSDTIINHYFIEFYDGLGKYLAPLRMPLFFMISGYLVHRSVTRYQWSEIAQKRIYNLVYLFLLWGSIQWLAITLINIVGGAEEPLTDVVNAVYAQSVVDFALLTAQGSSSLWYLYSLPLYYVICKLFGSRMWLGLAVMLMLHGIGQFVFKQWPTQGILSNGIYYGIGCFLGPLIFPLFNKLDKRVFILIAGLVVAFILLKMVGQPVRLIKSLMLVFISLVVFAWVQRRYDSPTLRWIGKNTLQIYVWHRIFIEMAGVWLVPALIAGGYNQNENVVLAWCALYPIVGMFVITGASLLCWKLTNWRIGKYFYTAPEFHTPITRFSNRLFSRGMT